MGARGGGGRGKKVVAACISSLKLKYSLSPISTSVKESLFKKPLRCKTLYYKELRQQSPQNLTKKARGRHQPLRPSPSFPPPLWMQDVFVSFTPPANSVLIWSPSSVLFPSYLEPNLRFPHPSFVCPQPPAQGFQPDALPHSRSWRARWSGWASGGRAGLSAALTERQPEEPAAVWASVGVGREAGRSGSLVRHLPPRLSPAPSLLQQVEVAWPGLPRTQTQMLGPSVHAFHIHISQRPSSSIDPCVSN